MAARIERLQRRHEPADPAPQAQHASGSAVLPAPVPVLFDTFGGTFQPAHGRNRPPVLMISPLGFEELCSRAFFAALADRLAMQGIASLRFDFPGTADALDDVATGLDDWRSATRHAAARLRQLSGHEELTVLGQGLGATLALAWAAEIGAIAAMVLLEPPASGRTYLRGLKAWGAVIASARGLAPEPANDGDLSVAGMVLPSERINAIAALKPDLTDGVPKAPLLVLSRAGNGTRRPGAQARAPGCEITAAEFAGYDGLLTDPTSSLIPVEAIETIAAWLAERRNRLAAAPVGKVPAPDALHGDGFTERPIRFGAGGRLAGVLCVPAGTPAPARAAILVNAGRDYHVGWARSSVLQARALARVGVATLRFDISGVGDSRVPGGFAGEILYSPQQCSDVRAAIDAMTEAGFARVGLVGRCSGAWAAFTTAAADERVDALVLLNTAYFVWDPSKSLAEVIRFAQRTVGDLGTTFLRRSGLRRLLAGDLDVRGALRFLCREANRRLLRPYGHVLGRLTPESRRYHEVHALLAALGARRVLTRLIYSQGDTSLLELRGFMGARLKRLARYPAISVCEIAEADHNFTTRAAQDRVRDELVRFFAAGRG